MKLALLALLWALPAAAVESSDLFLESYALESSYRYDAALERLRVLDATGENAYVLQLRRGWLLYLLGRYAESVDAYQGAIHAQPAVEARLGLTLPLMALRRWKDAELACKEILGVAPGNQLALTRYAYVLYNQGRFAEAERAYQVVIDQYPADLEMWAGLGWSQVKQGHKSQACAAFDTVLRFSPDHASALEGRQSCSAP
ncbi:MAG: tetratricopeptide repeat protein [Deltaproteobacteria bacterium]|nr:tetratricopeptide repeat protein [Deltaproteobacteria bacterium]